MNRAMNCTYEYMPSARLGHRSRPAAVRLLRELGAALLRVHDTVLAWQERAFQRRRLMELDDRLLRDMGIDRTEAAREYAKPFWRS